MGERPESKVRFVASEDAGSHGTRMSGRRPEVHNFHVTPVTLLEDGPFEMYPTD